MLNKSQTRAVVCIDLLRIIQAFKKKKGMFVQTVHSVLKN